MDRGTEDDLGNRQSSEKDVPTDTEPTEPENVTYSMPWPFMQALLDALSGILIRFVHLALIDRAVLFTWAKFRKT